MNSKDRDVLLDKLLDLMSQHHHSSYDTQGFPFVNDDGSFGLRAGRKTDGLYAAYFMMDKLAAGGLYAGGKPGTDMDTAAYTLAGKVFDVYDGVKLFLDEEGEITVNIKTEKPLAAICAAADKGIDAARAEYRNRAKNEMKGHENRRLDRQREKMQPIVSADADDKFVRVYLTVRVFDEFPGSDIRITNSAAPEALRKEFNDTRPRLNVSFNHPAGENYARFNAFHNGLGKVFNGFCAVSPFGGTDTRNEITVAGNIPRLAADILEHDSAGARRTLELLKGKVDDATLAAYDAYVERFDATKNEVASLTQGISQPIRVGGTLKIKAQP